MKRRLIHTFGIIASAMFAFAAGPAAADTIANGPYYATPSWDQTLPAATRFIVLSNMNSDAVLDRETGLVWEKSPDVTLKVQWADATFDCARKNVGGRRGWKLPSIPELASLLDGDVANTSSPRLPPGHPFLNVQTSTSYWSTTTFDVGIPGITAAFTVGFRGGDVGVFNRTSLIFVWCVRGGPGADAQ